MKPEQASQPQPPATAPQPSPAAHQKTIGIAVVALVFAFIVPLVGFILALVAKSQIKKTGDGGKGIATAALIISIVLFVVGLFVGVLFVLAVIRGAQLSSSNQNQTSTSSVPNANYSPDEQKAVDISNQFLQAIDTGDFAAAYNQMGPELQTKVGTSASFVSDAKAQNLQLIKGWKVTDVTTNTDKDRVTVKGTLTATGSAKTGTFELGYYKNTDGSIKMFSYDISPG